MYDSFGIQLKYLFYHDWTRANRSQIFAEKYVHVKKVLFYLNCVGLSKFQS